MEEKGGRRLGCFFPRPLANVISSTFLTQVGQRMYFSFPRLSVRPVLPAPLKPILLCHLGFGPVSSGSGGVWLSYLWPCFGMATTSPETRVLTLPDAKLSPIQRLRQCSPAVPFSPLLTSLTTPQPPCFDTFPPVPPVEVVMCVPQI